MTSSSFVSPLDCLTSFLGISLSRAVSAFGLPVYSSIHSRRITNAQFPGHYLRDEFPKLAEAAGNARGGPNAKLEETNYIGLHQATFALLNTDHRNMTIVKTGSTINM